MILTVAALAIALQTSGPAGGWTWTLYENSGPLVLANEVPDTPRLRATLECDRGSSIVNLALYEVAPASGIANITSGEAVANAEVETYRGRLQTSLRVDQPVFAAFQSTGVLNMTVGERELKIEVDRPNLGKLRRFAERCVG